MDYGDLRVFNLRTLRYFLVLADELHFGRAAARLNMSQPPLSQQIRQLETNIGADLFSRAHHNVELTAAGQDFYEKVPQIFQQLEKALASARLTARGQIGRLEIGTTSSSLVGVIPLALEAFREFHPDVEWQLHELAPAKQMQALLEKRIDVCLFRMPPEHEGLHREVIFEEELTVALPRSHPLAEHESLALGDLRREPFVMFDLGQSPFADFLYECCIRAGFVPHIRQQIFEVQTLLSLVGANMGVALVPASIRSVAPQNVVIRDLVSAPQIPLYAIYREADPSPILRNFLTVLRDKVAMSSVSR